MITVAARYLAWSGHPLEWFIVACSAVWFTRRAITNHPARIARLIAIVGLCLNASVTNANGGTMPVVGMPQHFVAASSLWQRAGAGSQLLFLADQASLYYFSIGDLLLIGGGIVLTFCWLHKKLGGSMNLLTRLARDEQGQDIAEYAVMLAVILVIVVGTIRMLGGSANNIFSSVNNSLQATPPAP